MTFEQLNCFIKAVEENTFFDAAETLHIYTIYTVKADYKTGKRTESLSV